MAGWTTDYFDAAIDSVINVTRYLSLHTADATAGNEISGGSPAYARIPVVAAQWGAKTSTAKGRKASLTVRVEFDVPVSVAIAGWGLWTASTGGTLLYGATLPADTPSNQGKYGLLPTLVQENP